MKLPLYVIFSILVLRPVDNRSLIRRLKVERDDAVWDSSYKLHSYSKKYLVFKQEVYRHIRQLEKAFNQLTSLSYLQNVFT